MENASLETPKVNDFIEHEKVMLDKNLVGCLVFLVVVSIILTSVVGIGVFVLLLR
ncbi:MAG: hypothetical protein P4L50_03170 [Anaerolineaceae bacterium]|nr:hypothetical protein [Anaerolineaceae bacterium]